MIDLSKSRRLRKQRRKKRRLKLTLGLFALAILITLGYSAFEYISGKQKALGSSNADAEENQTIEVTKSKYKESFKGVDNNDHKVNVLLLGIDQRDTEVPRTDTIMIAQYDTKAETAKVASLMRDTYVNIPEHGYNKINAAFAIGGPELLRQTISENFGIDLEYYSIVDFEGFTQVVDTIAPKGLDVDVKKDMYYKSAGGGTHIDLQAGEQRLSGEELLGYVRFRSDSQGDYGRVERQQEVMNLLKEKMISFSGVLKAPRLIGTLQPYIDTNMGSGKILQLGKDYLLNPVDQVETLRIPTDDNVWNERKDYPIGLVLAHDEVKTRETLQDYFNGEESS
ncbi:transcriptional regulator [Halobacillus sp. BBL2006]|nr:transcriptional regulator [Halobacillus sp. BBL2006]